MNSRGKSIDTTHLSVDHAEERGYIHRDYIAHCFRWSHAWKVLGSIRSSAARLLDVGCGADLPFLRLMLTGRGDFAHYCGVDIRANAEPYALEIVQRSSKRDKVKLCFNTDICKLEAQPFHFVTCFEMMEHVEPLHAWRALCKINSLLVRGDAIALFSTPCYDERVGAADNHVNEMTRDVFMQMLSDAGFKIEACYGTFASQGDYLPLMTPEERRIFDSLRNYYDSNVLSLIFAPMFPQASRNCLWHCVPVRDPLEKPQLSEWRKPWGSSDQWEALLTTTV